MKSRQQNRVRATNGQRRPGRISRTPTAHAGVARPGLLTEMQRLREQIEVERLSLEAEHHALIETQRDLEVSRDRYLGLFDFAPVGFALLDGHGRIQKINSKGAALLDQDRYHLLGKPLLLLVTKAERRKLHHYLVQVRRGSGEAKTELHFSRKGHELLLELTSTLAGPTEEGEAGILTAFRDLTELRRSEKEQERASRLPRENPAPVIRLDRAQILSYANPAADLVLAEWGVALGEEAPPSIVAVARSVLANAEERVLEMTFGERAYLVQIVPVPPANYVNIYFTDITERQQAERQIRVRDAINRVLAEASTLPEAAPRIIQSLCELAGWEAGAVWAVKRTANQLSCVEFWHVPSQTVSKFEAASRRHTFSLGIGLPGRVWRDGTPAWVPDVTQDNNFPRARTATAAGLRAGLCFPIKLHGEVLGVVECFSRKIQEPDTELLRLLEAIGEKLGQFMERKQAEEALRQSEERMRLVLDAALDAVITVDGRGCITQWNPQAEKIFGWTQVEARGQKLDAMIIPSRYSATYGRGLRRYLDTGTGPLLNQRFEITARRRDGREIPVELAITPVEVENQVYFSAFIRDITERKQSEEALRRARDELEARVRDRTAELTVANATLQAEMQAHKQAEVSRARLAAIVESSSDAIISARLDKSIVSWNNGAERVYGYGAEEMIGRPLTRLHPPHRRAEFQQVFECICRGEAVEPFETLRLTKDGRLVHVSLTLSAIKDAEGRVIGLSHIARDMTQRKQVEEALRASEARFRGFVESAPDAVVIVNERGQIHLVNSQTERLFGYRREELFGEPLELLLPELHRPRDRGPREDYWAETRASALGGGLELCGRRKDGTELPVEISLSPLQTETGVLMCSAIRDITSRKRAEKALKESEARFQAIMDNSPAMIFLKDTQGRYLHFNRPFAQQFHLSLEKTVGKTDAEIFSPEQAAAFRANDLKVIQTGTPVQFDETARHDDGRHISIVTKFPLFDLEGKIYAVGGIVTDITERKRLEAEVLQISEREQRRIAQDLHDGLGQQLAGLWCLSDVLRKDLEAQSLSDATKAAKIAQLLDIAVTHTRSLARGLHPVDPEPYGLMSALESLATNVTDLFKVSCQFECEEPTLIEDDAVSTHLYRITQEAVNNALRHGRAQHIKIGLSSSMDRIILVISNDGMRFKKSTGRPDGLGLRIMQYRADMIGGELSIEKKSERGAKVVCSVPRVARPAAFAPSPTATLS